MAHFAKLDENNIVKAVVVVSNDVATDEATGIAFLQNLTVWQSWKQTSYNNNIRKNFAGREFTYDEGRDAFIEPKPFQSWVLNESTCRYNPPIAYPGGTGGDGKRYDWNEENHQADNTTGWVEID